jgi:hypothetical protein
LGISALGPLQARGLILQVCKRHQLSNEFSQHLLKRTNGNASLILLNLWHLIDAGHLIFSKAGWAASSEIPWKLLPDDLHLDVARRLVDLSRETGSMLKGIAATRGLIGISDLTRATGWDRKQFDAMRVEVNRVYPVFQPSEQAIEPIVSSGILDAISEACTSQAEKDPWNSRIAAYLADRTSTSHHQELAELYEALGKTEAALTYRIAAAHKARSVTCYGNAARNLEIGLRHCKIDSGLRARLMIRLADIRTLQNQGSKARECAETAIQIAKRTGSLKLEADAKLFLAGLETMSGSLGEGLTKLDQSLALYKAADRTDGQLDVLGQMASVYRALEMGPQSDAINDEMLALSELENNPSSMATALVNAGISAAENGDRPGAAEHLYRALRMCRKNGYWDLITVALIDFADAASACEKPEDLDRYYLAAVASARRRFDETREIEAMHKLATAYLSTGAHSRASAAAQQVVTLAEHQGITSLLGDAKRIAAVCAAQQETREDASTYFAEALEISRLYKDEQLEASVMADQGDWLEMKSPDKAENLWREARNIFCRLGENAQVLRLDRSLIRHTYEHASQPLRYSEAI